MSASPNFRVVENAAKFYLLREDAKQAVQLAKTEAEDMAEFLNKCAFPDAAWGRFSNIVSFEFEP